MTTFIAKIHHGKLSLQSDLNRRRFQDFLQQNDGREVKIQDNDEITPPARKFFEGAVVPYFFFQHTVSYTDPRVAREALKQEFNPVWVHDIKGKRKQVGGSTAKMSKARFAEFLAKIQRWFDQNQYEWPDPETYKKWLDSAPPPDEVFPPLERLIKLAHK